MALLYTPIGFSGLIGNMPSGSLYNVAPGQTLNADDVDVPVLLARGFTTAAPEGSGTFAITDGTTSLTGISTLDFTGAVVSAGAAGIADVVVSAGTATVRSVNVSGGTTGLTATGGPITGAGTITLAGTLATANGGTGVNSLTGLMALQNAGTVVITGGSITGMPSPSGATDVANKTYVDATVQGLQAKPTATVATTTALATNTYNNGASGVGATITLTATGTLTIDGHVTALNDIVLVKNEATSANNGLYTVTTAGAVGVAAVLTRHVDMDTSAEVLGAFIPVGNIGTANANTLWLANPSTPYTIGTTALPFTQLNGATDLIAGSNIIISGNTINVGTLAATSLLGNTGTVAGNMAAIAIGANLTLSGGTLAAVAGAGVAADHGAVVNSGTVQIDNMVTLTGTNGGTVTIAPGSGTTWAVVNMPTAAGTVTFAGTPVFAGQRTLLDIKFGATVSTPSLNANFVAGGGITYTPGTVAGSLDRLQLASPDGTHWVYLAVEQGGTL